MTTAVVLFTRDLRVHDHPALAAACRRADRVVPLFVLDDAILGTRFAAPNRVAHLLAALRDLRTSLRGRGGELLVRRGGVVDVVRRTVVEVTADELHLSADVSAYARRREDGLRRLARELGGRLAVHAHPGVTLVPPGTIAPAGRDHFRVFTPYWTRWRAVAHRRPEPAPHRVPTPRGLPAGAIPTPKELVACRRAVRRRGAPEAGTGSRGAPLVPAPDLGPAGERAARAALERWLDGPVDRYGHGHVGVLDELASSRLSPHLHLGTLSVAELAAALDPGVPAHERFLRQLAWRDHAHQLLAAAPGLPRRDLRPRGDRWLDDPEGAAAWRAGCTGYPLVDAGMRQLLREGWMPGRVRMVAAHLLVKHLRIDWRVGAAHFLDHLVDGDLAVNSAQWQWVAGTGTDTRPNRFLDPVAQARRHDPAGAYVRRELAELAGIDGPDVHTPWRVPGPRGRAVRGYPPPIVDHRAARTRYLDEHAR